MLGGRSRLKAELQTSFRIPTGDSANDVAIIGKIASGTFNLRLSYHPSHRWRHAALGTALLALASLWPGAIAIGQDGDTKTVKDIIWARKVLMATAGDRSDQIRSMISERDIDLERARALARD